MRLAATLALLLSAAAPAMATEITLSNHSITGMGMQNVSIQVNVIPKEGFAETFSPPEKYYPFRLLGAHFFATGPNGAGNGAAKLTFVVYEDTGMAKPGKVLLTHTMKEPAEGSDIAIQTEDFPDQTIVTKGPIRLAVFTDTDSTKGGVTIPADPLKPAGTHSWLCGITIPGTECAWLPVSGIGLRMPSTWIIGLTIDTMNSVDVPDGGGGGMIPAGAPTVDSITPNVFPEGAGGAAIIRGRNFAINGTTVTLDGKKGPMPLTGLLVEDDKTVKVQIPQSLPLGDYDVVVQTQKGMGRLTRGLTIETGMKTGCSTTGRQSTSDASAFLIAAGLLTTVALRRRRKQVGAVGSQSMGV